mmetsp:Transcript_59466/g.193956  ORF Transcript_59466/g.193956 Transcript_59466/m.193956 type:complete len:179 (+) Transcript_59466:3950-4486(+)
MYNGGRICAVAAPVEGLDATPYMAEIQALLEVASAGLALCDGRRWQIWVDNKSAIGLVDSRIPSREYWKRMANQQNRWLRESARLVWVPAHGRHAEWDPGGIDDVGRKNARLLNDAADMACTQALQEIRRRDPARANWIHEREVAHLWAQQVLVQAACCQNAMRERCGGSDDPGFAHF